jgi:CubicO group peptidase (beta-lactamase class C family)
MVSSDMTMTGFPPSREDRVAGDAVHSGPRKTRWFMQHVREATGTANVSSHNTKASALPEDPISLDRVPVPDKQGGTWTWLELLAATDTDAIAVLRHGRLVYERYFNGMRPESTHAYYSISKSIGSCVAANIVARGLLDPDELASAYVPELLGSAYGDATVRNLLDMSVGISYVEDYDDDDSDDGRLQRLYGYKPKRIADEPGSTYDFATTTAKSGEHGGIFHYVSLNTDVLGWVMERASGASVAELIAREVWGKLGGEHDAFIALDGAGGAQLEAGFSSSLRDLARFGQMLCQGGVFAGQLVVPFAWIADAQTNGNRTAFSASPDADVLPNGSYRSGFWVSDCGDHVAMMGMGKYGQMLYVNQESGVVIAKFSSQERPSDDPLITLTFLGCESLVQTLL